MKKMSSNAKWHAAGQGVAVYLRGQGMDAKSAHFVGLLVGSLGPLLESLGAIEEDAIDTPWGSE